MEPGITLYTASTSKNTFDPFDVKCLFNLIRSVHENDLDFAGIQFSILSLHFRYVPNDENIPIRQPRVGVLVLSYIELQ